LLDDRSIPEGRVTSLENNLVVFDLRETPNRNSGQIFVVVSESKWKCIPNNLCAVSSNVEIDCAATL
jgi:hypothetical protein